ncbi:MAG: hypothetical protein HQL01_02565 [Nitrospirae bacterium]|nr:hypothetical protein [Nitrospirota bacterium]
MPDDIKPLGSQTTPLPDVEATGTSQVQGQQKPPAGDQDVPVGDVNKNYTTQQQGKPGAPQLQPPTTTTSNIDLGALILSLAKINEQMTSNRLQTASTMIQTMEDSIKSLDQQSLQDLAKAQAQAAQQQKDHKAGGIFGAIASVFMIVVGAVLDATGVGAALGTALIVGGVIGLAMDVLQQTGVMGDIVNGFSSLLQDMGVPKKDADIIANVMVAVIVIAATVVATAGLGAPEAVAEEAPELATNVGEDIAEDSESLESDATDTTKTDDATDTDKTDEVQGEDETQVTDSTETQEDESPAEKSEQKLEKRIDKDTADKVDKAIEEADAARKGAVTGKAAKYAVKFAQTLVQLIPQMVQAGLSIAEGVAAKDEAGYKALATLNQGQVQALQDMIGQQTNLMKNIMQGQVGNMHTIQGMIQAMYSAKDASAKSI